MSTIFAFWGSTRWMASSTQICGALTADRLESRSSAAVMVRTHEGEVRDLALPRAGM